MSDIPAGNARFDSIEHRAGIVNLPEEFREIARAANRAGLEGYEFVDAELGLDVDKARSRSDGGWDMPTRTLISYRKRQVVSITETRIAPRWKPGNRYWWINPLAIAAVVITVYLLVRWGLRS